MELSVNRRRYWHKKDTDYSRQYLTFVALERGTFKNSNFATQYSTDGGATWNSLAANTSSPTIAAGDKIMWKATITPTGSYGCGVFTSTCNFDVEGNAMSLLFGDNFENQTSLSGKSYAFYKMFYNNKKIINAEYLVLPATILSDYCYYNMFFQCTSLTAIPKLPATTLSDSCYREMFFGCTSLIVLPEDLLPSTTLAIRCYNCMFKECSSLINAPELPATTLANFCYSQMFYGCTALTTAPVLPASTLEASCYSWMFNSCTSLNSITCLATDISATNCTLNWVVGVATLGTFIKAPTMTSWGRNDSNIPILWTIQDYQE